ncbi:amidohydrolase family protein [Gammaproteobacteria bacterium]|nr:amidohydrolase family protein [Gammaproteobacteria bacterium]
MKFFYIAAFFLISSIASADEIKIFVANNILTLNSNNDNVEAVATQGSRIIDIGSREALISTYPNADLISYYKEATLVPGFIEHHIHPFLAAVTMNSEILAIEDWHLPAKTSKGVRDRASYLFNLSEIEQNHPANQPLVSWGFHHYFHGKLTKNDLDEISSIRPIIIIHRSFHEFILNTPAMELLGINKEAFNETPELNHLANFDDGHFSERGAIIVLPKLMQVLASPMALIQGLQKTRDYLHSNGITLIGNPGSMYNKDLQTAKNLIFGNEDSPFESYFFPSALNLSEQFKLDEVLDAAKDQTSWGKGKLNYLSKHIKLFADGAMYSQNMVMRDGYLDNHEGSWLMSLGTFENLFKVFWDDGFQIHIHQNGDAGLDRLLETLKKNLDRNPRMDHRTTVVHFGYSAKDQLKRMKELGVVVSANPYYVTALSDLYSRKGVGYERSQEMVRLGDAIKSGIKVALHSDMPMAPASPLMLMHAAVNRDNFAGKIAGPNQRISKIEALKAVTINAAYVLRLEKMYGSIEVGKYANFTALNQNPLMIKDNQIKDIEILGTVLKGDAIPLN